MRILKHENMKIFKNLTTLIHGKQRRWFYSSHGKLTNTKGKTNYLLIRLAIHNVAGLLENHFVFYLIEKLYVFINKERHTKKT